MSTHTNTSRRVVLAQKAKRSLPYFGLLAALLAAFTSAQGLLHAAEESNWTKVAMLAGIGAILGYAVSKKTHLHGVCDDEKNPKPRGNMALWITLLAGGIHVFSDALVLHASPSLAALAAAIVAIISHEIIRTGAVGGVLASILNIPLWRGVAYSAAFTVLVLVGGLASGAILSEIYPEDVLLPLSIGYFITSLLSLTWHRLLNEAHNLEGALHAHSH